MSEKKELPTTRRLAKKRFARLKSYQDFFNSPVGKQVLYDLISNHWVMNSTFCKDPIEMALKEGERNVVLRILTILKTKPEKITKLLEEADEYASKNFME